jgi:hypothetical protein
MFEYSFDLNNNMDGFSHQDDDISNMVDEGTIIEIESESYFINNTTENQSHSYLLPHSEITDFNFCSSPLPIDSPPLFSFPPYFSHSSPSFDPPSCSSPFFSPSPLPPISFSSNFSHSLPSAFEPPEKLQSCTTDSLFQMSTRNSNRNNRVCRNVECTKMINTTSRKKYCSNHCQNRYIFFNFLIFLDNRRFNKEK